MTIQFPSQAQVRWQCRRGMLELDIILLSFFDTYYEALNLETQAVFIRLLETPDPELYAWLMGQESPPLALQKIVLQIRSSFALKNE